VPDFCGGAGVEPDPDLSATWERVASEPESGPNVAVIFKSLVIILWNPGDETLATGNLDECEDLPLTHC
jgi:hypothetical protein